jgi:hypothetical protein
MQWNVYVAWAFFQYSLIYWHTSILFIVFFRSVGATHAFY